MPSDSLSRLQWKVLEILAEIEPIWTLTGGAALAGFHLQHRPTRDLDLFWRGISELGSLPTEVRRRLTSRGLEVSSVQTAPAFTRFRVTDGSDVCVVDLVAEPVTAVEPPLRRTVEGVSIAVDTPYEILVNKLCALLSRSELRDLADIKALLQSGGALDQALADAPRKDAGFSPLTLAWTLRNLQPVALARAAGLSQDEAQDLDRFRVELIERILEASAPNPQN